VKKVLFLVDWWKARVAVNGVEELFASCGSRDARRAGPARTVSVKAIIDVILSTMDYRREDGMSDGRWRGFLSSSVDDECGMDRVDGPTSNDVSNGAAAELRIGPSSSEASSTTGNAGRTNYPNPTRSPIGFCQSFSLSL